VGDRGGPRARGRTLSAVVRRSLADARVGRVAAALLSGAAAFLPACGDRSPEGAEAGQVSDAPAPGRPEPWRFEIVDEEGRPTPARVSLRGPGGRALFPLGEPGHLDGAGRPYFYSTGSFEVETAASHLDAIVRKGFEHEIVDRTVERSAGTSRLRLARAFDMKAKGYYSGDGHIHPHYGDDGIPPSNAELLVQMKAEDLNLANLLAANLWGSRIYFGERLTGRIEPDSEPERILRVSEEYRSNVYGHMSVYRTQELGDPLFTAFAGTRYPFDHPTNYEAARRYRDAGAFASFAHLRPLAVGSPGAVPECPVDVVLGVLHAIEIQGYAVITALAQEVWEHLLSAGYDVVITAGTDAMLGFRGAWPIGGARSYVAMDGRAFDYDAWTDQLARGRGFTTNGPLLFLAVDGRTPGEALELAPGETREATVEVEVDSLFPWDEVRVRSNRSDVLVFASDTAHSRQQAFRGRVTLRGPAWIYATVIGPHTRHVDAGRVEREPPLRAVSNAIWVRRGREARHDPQSLDFLMRWVASNLETLEQRNNYGSPRNRESARRPFLEALRLLRERREAAPSEGSGSSPARGQGHAAPRSPRRFQIAKSAG
jgi:hypothetical protein